MSRDAALSLVRILPVRSVNGGVHDFSTGGIARCGIDTATAEAGAFAVDSGVDSRSSFQAMSVNGHFTHETD